jgi:hypothetical protein
MLCGFVQDRVGETNSEGTFHLNKKYVHEWLMQFHVEHVEQIAKRLDPLKQPLKCLKET